jgi:hypothetical protein
VSDDMSKNWQQEAALLRILIGCGEKTIEAFQASANPVDEDFLVELERVIQRSRDELEAMTSRPEATA